MSESLTDVKTKRFKFLNRVHELSDGGTRFIVNMFQVGEELGFDRKDTARIVDYLIGENLVEAKVLGGGISLTHWGLKQVEEALREPEQPTYYFPPVNVIHIGQMSNSQIQQGSHHSNQTGTFTTSDVKSLEAFVTDLKSKLDQLDLTAESRAEMESDITTIEAQLTSPKPKSAVLQACLDGTRSVLEKTAANVIASGLLHELQGLHVPGF